jgi:hypothetical protein
LPPLAIAPFGNSIALTPTELGTVFAVLKLLGGAAALGAAAIARFDPSGRAIMLVPAAFALGSMVGPGAAGFLVSSGYQSLLLIALVSACVPMLAYGLLLAHRLKTLDTTSMGATA